MDLLRRCDAAPTSKPTTISSAYDVMPVISQGANPDELEKRIGSCLMAGQPLISIDNVDDELFGAALCQIISQRKVHIRILGKSEKVDIEAGGTTFFANGNNLVIRGDLWRRTITMGLDRKVERPDQFKFTGDPVATVLADRGKYIAAVLTICRWYVAAGRPGCKEALAGFGGWSNTIRSALIALGKADPVLSIEAARTDDPDFVRLRELVEAWAEAAGTGVKTTLRDLIEMASETRSDGGGNSALVRPRLNAVLRAVGENRGRIDATILGNYLRGRKGRIVSGLLLENKYDESHGSKWWVAATDGREVEASM
jgi:hypothetical protein